MAGETNQVKWRGIRPVEGIRGVWPARNAERVHATDYQVAVAEKVLYTVPAGKILFISGVSVHGRRSAAGVGRSSFKVRDAADTDVYWIAAMYFSGIGHMNLGYPFTPALEAAAGYDVYAYLYDEDQYIRGIMHGWLEDA